MTLSHDFDALADRAAVSFPENLAIQSTACALLGHWALDHRAEISAALSRPPSAAQDAASAEASGAVAFLPEILFSEATVDQAPGSLRTDCANAWTDGWNACLDDIIPQVAAYQVFAQQIQSRLMHSITLSPTIAEPAAHGEREALARVIFAADHPWVREKPLTDGNGWDSHTKKDGAHDGAQRRYLSLADAVLAWQASRATAPAPLTSDDRKLIADIADYANDPKMAPDRIIYCRDTGALIELVLRLTGSAQ